MNISWINKLEFNQNLPFAPPCKILLNKNINKNYWYFFHFIIIPSETKYDSSKINFKLKLIYFLRIKILLPFVFLSNLLKIWILKLKTILIILLTSTLTQAQRLNGKLKTRKKYDNPINKWPHKSILSSFGSLKLTYR